MEIDTTPNLFYPKICPHCGSILDQGASPPRQSKRRGLLAWLTRSEPDVCEHCGQELSPGLEKKEAPPTKAPDPTPIEPPERVTIPTLTVLSSGRKIDLSDIALIFLGRCDTKHHIYPHLDLTRDEGMSYGVSRQHACIHQNDAGLHVEDMDSTNGTFLNGQRLSPFKVYPLHNGDVLQLGKLEVKVQVARCEKPAPQPSSVETFDDMPTCPGLPSSNQRLLPNPQ